MPLLERPAAVVGATGTGKTFAAKGVVQELLALERRVLGLATRGGYWNGGMSILRGSGAIKGATGSKPWFPAGSRSGENAPPSEGRS